MSRKRKSNWSKASQRPCCNNFMRIVGGLIRRVRGAGKTNQHSPLKIGKIGPKKARILFPSLWFFLRGELSVSGRVRGRLHVDPSFCFDSHPWILTSEGIFVDLALVAEKGCCVHLEVETIA